MLTGVRRPLAMPRVAPDADFSADEGCVSANREEAGRTGNASSVLRVLRKDHRKANLRPDTLASRRARFALQSCAPSRLSGFASHGCH